MGFLFATLIKARMAHKAVVKTFACSSCNTLANVTIMANRISVTKCSC